MFMPPSVAPRVLLVGSAVTHRPTQVTIADRRADAASCWATRNNSPAHQRKTGKRQHGRRKLSWRV